MSKSEVSYLKMAARLGLRGHGGAEPNPLVGCLIVRPDASIVGWGYHRNYGGSHAEIVALLRAGKLAAGATLYCTLEPCNHQGKTGPCTSAIIDARIARVVIARRDPFPPAAGGIERLQAAGIKVEVIEHCASAIAISDPFIHRLRSGLPWVTVKWAQTIDGQIALPSSDGKHQWISNEASRKIVHRERGRVDAIMTGIGTVRADDPLLTAREVRVRRVAKRVVIDPQLQILFGAKLVNTSTTAPTIVFCDQSILEAESNRVQKLRDRSVEIIGMPMENQCLPLAPVLRMLVSRYNIANVLVEAGTGLMSSLFRQNLVNEAWVFIAPMLLGNEKAGPSITGINANELMNGRQWKLLNKRQRGSDVILKYRVV